MADLDPQTQRLLRQLAEAHASTATAREAVGKVESYLPSGSLAEALRAVAVAPYARQARAAQAQHAALEARLDSADPQRLRRRPVKARVRPKIDPARDARVQREIAADSVTESVTDHRMAVVVSTLTERLEPLGLLGTVVDLLRQADEREARMEARAVAAEERQRAAEHRETEALELARRNFWVAVAACLITALTLVLTL